MIGVIAQEIAGLARDRDQGAFSDRQKVGGRHATAQLKTFL